MTLYSPETLSKFEEKSNEVVKNEIAQANNVAINDVIVRKAYKPEKIGSAYAIILDFSVKDETAVFYYFINKKKRYTISVFYPNKINDSLKESLDNTIKNIIWDRKSLSK